MTVPPGSDDGQSHSSMAGKPSPLRTFQARPIGPSSTYSTNARDVVIPALDPFPYEELRFLRFAELVPRDASSTGTKQRRLERRRRSSQQSPSAAAAAATFVAASPIDRLSPVVNPDRAASRGLTSRRASNVVP